jgi:hypothetical protein
MKKPSLAEVALHIACWIGMAACYGLGELAFPNDATAKAALLTAGGVLYGKLCFKPANPILARVLQALAPAEVQRLSQRPSAARAELLEQAQAAQPVTIISSDAFRRPDPAPRDDPTKH